jgi:NAD(P)-dependent dehydrogenase (short-subunit alcohol dehydrogenase family)
MPAAKTILITGCSSPQGIGFATARGLADRGHVVHATVRHHENDASLIAGYEERMRVHELDLLDRTSITAVVDAITGGGESIDVLVNNAAYGLIGGVEQVDLDRARASFDTDFFGTMAVIQRSYP